jgi:hypothetical protein
MVRTYRLAGLVLFPLIIGAAGCESIALMPRPDIDEPARRVERDRDIPRDSRSNVPRDEIVGTVERIDKGRNEIQLRTTDARVVTIKYDPSTLVYNRDREVGIDALLPRDLILARVSRGSGGEQYADVIRLNDRGDLGSRR